jgi:hypothetical protein
MAADADTRELFQLYAEMSPASQQALLPCARLLMTDEPEFLQPYLVEHMAIQTRL